MTPPDLPAVAAEGGAPNESGRANRVAPDGTLHAVAARGQFWGNRGQLLDARGHLSRPWQSRAWITCLLDYKGWHRTQWRPKRLTELYFFDEPTALAAGHRPCGECRRADYQRFKTAWMRAHDVSRVTAPQIDQVLHADRLGPAGPRTHRGEIAALPDGAIVEFDHSWWLVRAGHAHQWSWTGYRKTLPLSAFPDLVTVCTPAGTLAAIRAGYQPDFGALSG